MRRSNVQGSHTRWCEQPAGRLRTAAAPLTAATRHAAAGCTRRTRSPRCPRWRMCSACTGWRGRGKAGAGGQSLGTGAGQQGVEGAQGVCPNIPPHVPALPEAGRRLERRGVGASAAALAALRGARDAAAGRGCALALGVHRSSRRRLGLCRRSRSLCRRRRARVVKGDCFVAGRELWGVWGGEGRGGGGRSLQRACSSTTKHGVPSALTVVLPQRRVQPLFKLIDQLLKVAARHVRQPNQLLPAAQDRRGGCRQRRSGASGSPQVLCGGGCT